MSPSAVVIADLMEKSGVKFGTSGARGLAADMTDYVCYVYTMAFIQHLQASNVLPANAAVAVGGDLRPSTDRIMAAVARAVTDSGLQVQNCGKLPSPALACHGLHKGMPTAMVTGSHIPDDRNGIKYTKIEGEILKADEAAMRRQAVQVPVDLFDAQGGFQRPQVLPLEQGEALAHYVQRYTSFLGPDSLKGLRLGAYLHSAVGRDVLVQILEALGAEVAPLGRTDTFIPVDTEAIRTEDIELARRWAQDHHFDAIVSTDGDSDRPLISDEQGRWLRGDVAGILCARYLAADAVVTPVSSNSALEKSGYFPQIIRTRVGSPYVIEGMLQARQQGARRVVGYEANGGFLLASDIVSDGRRLAALPTRDAVIVHLAVLLLAKAKGQTIGQLLRELPSRFTHSDRLKNFPTAISQAKLTQLHTGIPAQDRARIEAVFEASFGKVAHVNALDGLRIEFVGGEVIHLRPSGNAPEFRCYSEADSPARAAEIVQTGLEIVKRWL